MVKSYTPLHVHSHYSALDGLSSPEAHMKRASELGMSALALTDHGNLGGAIDFYEAGKKYDVKPILGIEAYEARQTRFHRDEIERSNKKATDEFGQSGPHHMTILAKNYTGYKNLLKISSKAFLESFYVKPRIDIDLLAEHSEGIMATSACLNGKIPQAILRDDFDYALEVAGNMQDVLGKDNFFIEVQDHGLDDQRYVMKHLVEISKHINAPIIPTPDAHYACPEEAKTHDILLAIGTGSKIQDENRFQFPSDGFYLPSYEEMARLFPEEWLKNTSQVAEMCELELDFNELYFPHFEVPTQQDPIEYFKQEVYEGLKQKYGDPIPDNVQERADYEIDVIERMGFVEYFLIVADVVNWCDHQGIRTGPRGSAASSICSYALNIIKIDPLFFSLRFERFLNEGRGSAPDVDLDIADDRREEVIEYTRQKYGDDHVAHIGTYARSKAKGAIRDVARVLGYPYQKGDEVANMIPDPVQGFTYSIDEALEASRELEQAYAEDDEVKDIIDNAKGIEGVVRQPGIHAGGIVISQSEMTEHIPVMQRPDKNGKFGPIVTQWEDDRVEQVGLLKMDYLGLSNLTTIGRAIDNIKQRLGVEIDFSYTTYNDSATFELLRRGDVLGIFQIESPQMRDLLVAIAPDNIFDIMALISLYRPGPLGAGIDKDYVKRKHGKKDPVPLHPALEGPLQTTYGLLLYQENVLDAAKHVAGFSPTESDELRSVVAKKKKEKIPAMREKFVKGCQEYSQLGEDDSHKVFDAIEGFGAYGFPKGHGASYSTITYQTAYLKANYSADYMAALLTTTKTKGEMGPYINECRRMGLNIIPPSVNRSQHEFVVEDDKTIVFGLDSIDGVGPKVVTAILEARESGQFHSLYDFLRRVPLRVLDRRALSHLAAAGVFDELVQINDQRSLSYEDIRYLLETEYSELGMYVSGHPVEGVQDVLSQNVTCDLERLINYEEEQKVVVGGVLTYVEKKETKRGKDMWILTLEDLTTSITVLVFGKSAQSLSFERGELVLLHGKTRIEGDEQPEAKLFLWDKEPLPLPKHPDEQPLCVMFNEQPSYEEVQSLASVGWHSNGAGALWFTLPSENHYVTLEVDSSVDKNHVKQKIAERGYQMKEIVQ